MLNKTKNGKRYSECFKQQVVSEISAGMLSRSGAVEKYGASLMSIDRWCRSYGILGSEWIDLPLDKMNSTCTSKSEDAASDLPQDAAALKRRLRELEVRLLAAELRAEAAEMIIDIAEKDLGLEIRKKSVTKQSGK